MFGCLSSELRYALFPGAGRYRPSVIHILGVIAVAKDDAFIEYLHELLGQLGRISTKKMFGGHGVYCDGVIMGLVINETLFLKVDEQTMPKFSEAGCQPFVYHMKDKQVAMSYWSVPVDAMESSDEMLPWARHAYAAALRKDKPASSKKKKT